MGSLGERVYDAGLSAITSQANRLEICSAEPTTYAEAVTTYSLGNKLAPLVSPFAPAIGGDGYEVTIDAIVDGNVVTSGDATHFALVDTNNQELLVAGDLAAPVAVVAPDTFELTEFTVRIPDAV